MSNEPVNIVLNSHDDIDGQKLMEFLSGKLSAEENLKIEKLIAEPGLLKDAVQGLQQFENKNNLSAFVDQLNADLHKQLQKKKQRKLKRRFKNDQWVYTAIIITLLLITMAFIIIRGILGNNL